MDGGIHSRADHRPGIGRIDDGVHGHLGNIVSDDLKGQSRRLLIGFYAFILTHRNAYVQ
jgi:hypothetical protein